ncbi:MAG: histidinol dehydrogenase [Nitrospirae bacterium]|nr:MAG: histidinol dehydrogenase [Nitrospirota bacterium]
MKLLKSMPEVRTFLQLLNRRAAGVSPETEATVKSVLADVRKRGDKAVASYTKKFDKHTLPLELPAADIRKAAAKADKNVVRALELSARRIWDFHEQQKEESWAVKVDGALLGQMVRPLARVGVYVPGGKASYPSTVLMNVIPAQVAGVREIALCVPTPGGEINPYVMAAIRMLGIAEAYRIGGAQAVGAMAYGTDTIRRVDKIVGPGNIYVALAKKMVFGEVDIDMIAGPSEILIIADKTANPAFVAADMLSQAEHDELASSILVTDSPEIAEAVAQELEAQLRKLKRRAIAEKSLKAFGAIILVENSAAAVAVSNAIAPEHLEVMTEKPQDLLDVLTNAGAIFLGQWTPEPLGDYSAGPNHTLPTGGTARFSSPLGVYDFMKRSSVLQFDAKSFGLLADTVERIADSEGLEAHANTIRIRKAALSDAGGAKKAKAQRKKMSLPKAK